MPIKYSDDGKDWHECNMEAGSLGDFVEGKGYQAATEPTPPTPAMSEPTPRSTSTPEASFTVVPSPLAGEGLRYYGQRILEAMEIANDVWPDNTTIRIEQKFAVVLSEMTTTVEKKQNNPETSGSPNVLPAPTKSGETR